MRKVFKELTQDQKDRGVIFSSTLSKFQSEQPGDRIHEVTDATENKELIIHRLNDDKFFKNSPWKYNIIRR